MRYLGAVAAVWVGVYGVVAVAAPAEAKAETKTETEAKTETGGKLISYVAEYRLSLYSARPDTNILNAEGFSRSRFQEKCQEWQSNDEFYLAISGVDQSDHIIATKSAATESKSGQNYHFQTDRWQEGEKIQTLSGVAVLDKNFQGSVKFNRPKPDKIKFTDAVAFPTRLTTEIIKAARARKNFYQARLFDGSSRDGGMMATVAIGAAEHVPSLSFQIKNKGKNQKQSGQTGEKSDHAAELRWPISMALFDTTRPATFPAYQVMIWLRENGISDEMRMDFGGFIIKASLSQIQKLPVNLPSSCP